MCFCRNCRSYIPAILSLEGSRREWSDCGCLPPQGGRVRRAAWRRPLEVTDLGAFGPKVLLLGASAQNTPPGCICGVLDCRAEAFYFLFLSQKESSKEKCSLRKDAKGFRPLRRATRASPWTYRPLEKGGPKLYLARLPACALINAVRLLPNPSFTFTSRQKSAKI